MKGFYVVAPTTYRYGSEAAQQHNDDVGHPFRPCGCWYRPCPQRTAQTRAMFTSAYYAGGATDDVCLQAKKTTHACVLPYCRYRYCGHALAPPLRCPCQRVHRQWWQPDAVDFPDDGVQGQKGKAAPDSPPPPHRRGCMQRAAAEFNSIRLNIIRGLRRGCHGTPL